MEIPILSLMLLVSLVGALVTFFLGKTPKMAKISALVFSAIPMVLALFMPLIAVTTTLGRQAG